MEVNISQRTWGRGFRIFTLSLHWPSLWPWADHGVSLSLIVSHLEKWGPPSQGWYKNCWDNTCRQLSMMPCTKSATINKCNVLNQFDTLLPFWVLPYCCSDPDSQLLPGFPSLSRACLPILQSGDVSSKAVLLRRWEQTYFAPFKTIDGVVGASSLIPTTLTACLCVSITNLILI